MRTGGKDFGSAYSRLNGIWLRQKKLEIYPFEVVEGGLRGLETALKTLTSRKSSAVKFVIRAPDAPNLKRSSDERGVVLRYGLWFKQGLNANHWKLIHILSTSKFKDEGSFSRNYLSLLAMNHIQKYSQLLISQTDT